MGDDLTMKANKREPIVCDCAIHGKSYGEKDVVHLYSSICTGYVCLECVKDRFFVDDIESELREDYPEYFKGSDAC